MDASVVPIFLAILDRAIPPCTNVSANVRCSSVNLRLRRLFVAFLLLAIDASQLAICQPFWGRPPAPQLRLSLVDFPGQFAAELWGSKQLVTSEQKIIGGVTVTTDSIGTPSVTTPQGGTCTGTMLRRQWLLTARHCTTTDGQIWGPDAAPSTVSVRLLNGSNAPSGDAIWRHSSYDVALVHLQNAPTNAAGNTIVSNRLYNGDVSKLATTTLLTQGWGNNAITACTPKFAGTGAGTLRTASLKISSVSGSSINVEPTSGAIEWTGDSGSSLFQSVAGLNRPVGVESTGNCTQNPLAVTAIQHVRADYFRAWAEGIIGAAPAAGIPAAYERADGVSAVVYPSSKRVRELALTSGGWVLGDLTTAANTSKLAASELTAYVRSDGKSAVVYRDTDGHVREIALNGNAWTTTDLSGSGSTVPSGSGPTAYVRSDGVSAVLYRGSDSHVHELSRSSSGTWTNTDLTSTTGAPSASANPLGYVRADGISAVVYRSTSGRVIELARVGSSWSYGDLSAVVNATVSGKLATSNASPRPYTRSDGVSVVAYIDANGELEEMALVGGRWMISSFVGFVGGGIKAISPYLHADGTSAVLYVNSDNHVREVALEGGSWRARDLSGSLGAPTADVSGAGTRAIPSGYVRADNVTSVVYTAASTSHVIELALVGSTWSWYDLTNVVGGL